MGSNYDRAKCRERKYERIIMQRIPRRYWKTWKGIHRRDNLAKWLSTRSLISLHQSIRYECGGNLLSTKPAPAQALDSFLCRVNVVELDKYFPLQSVVGSVDSIAKKIQQTCDESLSTLIASTFPYFSSHSPLTSSARSLSQSRSVSLVVRSVKSQTSTGTHYFSGSNMFFRTTDLDVIVCGM